MKNKLLITFIIIILCSISIIVSGSLGENRKLSIQDIVGVRINTKTIDIDLNKEILEAYKSGNDSEAKRIKQIAIEQAGDKNTIKNILEKNSLEYKLQNPTHELLKQTIEDLISNNNIDLEQYKHKVKDNLKMQLKLQRKDKLENLLYKLNSDNVQEISIELINFMNESNKSISEANKK